MLCTTSRARKVIVALTLVALITAAIHPACWHLFMTDVAYYINMIMFNGVVPVAVLIINAIVVREVRRRASSNAASNLGIQHHQSTSSNSAVPTVMLVITSLLYVLLNGMFCFALVAFWQLNFSYSYDFHLFRLIASMLYTFVFAYNFYVYLVTGKQFRSELRKLFCACCRRCRSSSPAAAAAAAAVKVRVVRRGQADTAV